jgi:hypothetical protein
MNLGKGKETMGPTRGLREGMPGVHVPFSERVRDTDASNAGNRLMPGASEPAPSRLRSSPFVGGALRRGMPHFGSAVVAPRHMPAIDRGFADAIRALPTKGPASQVRREAAPLAPAAEQVAAIGDADPAVLLEAKGGPGGQGGEPGERRVQKGPHGDTTGAQDPREMHGRQAEIRSEHEVTQEADAGDVKIRSTAFMRQQFHRVLDEASQGMHFVITSEGRPIVAAYGYSAATVGEINRRVFGDRTMISTSELVQRRLILDRAAGGERFVASRNGMPSYLVGETHEGPQYVPLFKPAVLYRNPTQIYDAIREEQRAGRVGRAGVATKDGPVWIDALERDNLAAALDVSQVLLPSEFLNDTPAAMDTAYKGNDTAIYGNNALALMLRGIKPTRRAAMHLRTFGTAGEISSRDLSRNSTADIVALPVGARRLLTHEGQVVGVLTRRTDAQGYDTSIKATVLSKNRQPVLANLRQGGRMRVTHYTGTLAVVDGVTNGQTLDMYQEHLFRDAGSLDPFLPLILPADLPQPVRIQPFPVPQLPQGTSSLEERYRSELNEAYERRFGEPDQPENS